jgi:hypothetical protein
LSWPTWLGFKSPSRQRFATMEALLRSLALARHHCSCQLQSAT